MGSSDRIEAETATPSGSGTSTAGPEAALAASQKHTQLILDSVGEGIHGLDAQGRVTFLNPAARALLGWDAEALVGREAHALVHHHHRDGSVHTEAECPIRRTLRDGVARRVDDDTFFRRDGSSFAVAYVCTPVQDEAGRTTGAVVCFRDVSEALWSAGSRKLEAEALEAITTREPLAAVLERIARGVEDLLPGAVVSILTPDGSRSLLRLAAGPHLPPTFTAPDFVVPVGPRSGTCGTAAFRREIVITADIERDPLWEDFGHLALPYGLRACWSVPALDAEGRVQATFALYHRAPREPRPGEVELVQRAARIVRIALERDRKEQELRASEERIRATFRDAATGIATTTLDGRFLEANTAYQQMLGYTMEELRATDFLSVTHPEDRPRNALEIAELLAGRRDAIIVVKRYLHKSGRTIWTRLSVSLVRDLEGRPIGITGVAEDVTARRAIEEQLARSQSLLRFAGRMTRVGGWAVSVPDHTVMLSDTIVEMLELDGSAPMALPDALELVDRAWRDRVVDALASSELDGTPFDLELELVTARGRPIWGRVVGEAERDELGRIRELHGAFSDITQRRAEEAHLRRLELAISRVNDIVLICDALPPESASGFQVLFVNDALERVLGYAPRELLGQSAAMLLGPRSDAATRARLREAVAASRPIRAELLQYHKDGSERWLEVDVTPIIDGSGRHTHWVAVQRDITERTFAEEARQREQALLRIASRIGRLGAWRVELPSRRLVLSDEARAIYGLDDVAADPEVLFAMLSPDGGQALRAAFRRCLTDGEPYDLEALVTNARGRTLWVRVLGEAERDESGAVVGVQGAVQDIDERKQAERTLAASEARFRQLAEAMPMMVWTATPEGRDDFANHHYFDYTGLARNHEAITQWDTCVHPDDLPGVRAAWQRALATGEPYVAEYRFRRHDGAWRWFRGQARPEKDARGRVVKWYGTRVDVDDTRRLQEEATELARRLTSTLESITDGFVTLDADWTATYVNPAAERLLGHPRAELLGRPIWQALPELAGGALEAALRRAREGLVTAQLEVPFAPAPGVPPRWLAVTVYPADRGLTVYIHDVTDRRAYHDALRASEERFRLLARASHDAIWDWDLASGSLWWNEGYEELFGRRRDTLDPGIRSWSDYIHPEDRPRILADVYGLIDRGGTSWSADYRFMHHDGHFVDVNDRGHVIRDADGRPVRMVGGMTDISERTRQERRLREQATLLDKAQDAILVRDLEHRIVYWNRSAERLYGWSSDEVIGRAIEGLIYDDPTAFRQATELTLARGEWTGELVQKRRDGQPLIVEARWTLVRDEVGRPRSIMATNTDITEKKRLEQQFLRAQRLESVGTLAGGVAHDLNNMLAPILMTASVMLDEETDAQKIEDLRSIEQCARRGADMVRQLLSFARGTDGRRARVHLGDIVNEIKRMVRDTFPKNITLRLDVAPDLWALDADATQIHQLLTNLCVNARDAMPDGGTLTLRAEQVMLDELYTRMAAEGRPGPYAVLTVEDTGHGMSREVMDRMFEPFFTTKDVGKGTGLGLSTVHAIVKSHGGFVHAYSELGRGTRFRVYLPVDAPAGSIAREEAPELGALRGKGELVLVVDDERPILEVARRTLERYGYRVMTATNGAEAVATYATHADEIAVVLTDMAMPVMDGPSTVAALRALDPHVRVVASSGLTSEGGVARTVEAGVRHFVPKPHTADTLLRVLRRALDEARQGG